MNRLLPRSSTQLRPATGDLFDEFDRLRNQLMASFGTSSETVGGWLSALGDLEEADDEFIITVEVPGFDRDDIKVELEGRRLSVHAESEEPERQGTVRSSTRSRHLHHEVTVPSDVDQDSVQASLDKGVLTVRLRKDEQGSRRRIEIQ